MRKISRISSATYKFGGSRSPWRRPLPHGLEERCDLAQSIGVVADQGMAAGWKDDGPAVGHAGGNILRPTGRAEPIVFGTDCQDRAGDLLDRIRLVRDSSLNVEVHPC